MARAPSEFVLYVEDALGALGPVERTRFFGGWSFVLRGTRIAYVLRDRLLFPVDAALRRTLIAEGCGPFAYEKGGRTVVVERFYEAPSACLDDPDALLDWAGRAAAAAGAGAGGAFDGPD
ncbi:TfoX/Sxy family protein [Albimonas sp. CAU 1670]|uniref:TfoX/Sxy family protein n=1 Tax=Albimonas sp. CAU 1670 TaxID=3032599 RepID=UPI0023DBC75B|nr:TfoX/Sxy family protein [Albimonas sp. CAU 1670]MDF2235234.1 TfoX/Sxy family protein [Albimonas sp. CAU 1670]